MLDFENKLFEKGLKIIAGADEVGRGAFAGPVVVGCVMHSSLIFPKKNSIIINDSKKLTAKQREESAIWIKKNFLHAIGTASNLEINKFGIVKATHMAYRRALVNLEVEHLLLDAFYVPYLKNIPKKNQTPIIKGDSKSFLIASASIIAKVYRDNLMTEFSKHESYKPYMWHKNKGYGTKAHREAIKMHGPCHLHRELFIRSSV